MENYIKFIENIESMLPLSPKPKLINYNTRNIRNIRKSRKFGTLRRKEIYILDFLSRYIIDQFINGICTIIEDNSKKNFKPRILDDRPHKKSKLVNFNSKTDVKFIEGLGSNSSSFSRFGKPTDLTIEVQNIVSLIDYYKPQELSENFNKCFKALITISRYLYSRIEAEYNFQEASGYQVAMEDYVNKMIDLKANYFHSNFIRIPLISDDSNSFDPNVDNILKLVREYEKIENDFHNGIRKLANIQFKGLSEGENSLIEIITKLKFSAETAHPEGLTLILLDEPDRALHPEWSRIFLNVLADIISKMNVKVQVVITTHSPYMLSDVFPENVFQLRRENETDLLKLERLSESEKKFSCFGANIYDLMQNSFFMSNTIGEFATLQIKRVYKEILELDDNSSPETLEMIEQFISNIGEPVLRNTVERQYRQQLRKINRLSSEDIHNILSNPILKEKVKNLLEEGN